MKTLDEMNKKDDELELVIKSIRENGGLNQEDIETLKRIVSLDKVSRKYQGLVETVLWYVRDGYNCFTEFIETELRETNEWIIELKESGACNKDAGGCDELNYEEYKVTQFENTINFIKDLNLDSINKVVDIFEDYSRAIYEIDNDPGDIPEFAKYILENKSNMNLSPIAVTEEVEN